MHSARDGWDATLALDKARLWELFKEVFECELSPDTAGQVEKALRAAMAKASQHPGSSRAKRQSATVRSRDQPK